jgi:hypothetical protein
MKTSFEIIDAVLIANRDFNYQPMREIIEDFRDNLESGMTLNLVLGAVDEIGKRLEIGKEMSSLRAWLDAQAKAEKPDQQFVLALHKHVLAHDWKQR